jgi:glycosyltransferase involved in cell wall biosynthesis
LAAEPTSAQRKLLLLAPFAPRSDAPHGGGRVLAQVVSRLAGRHRLALAYLRGAGEPPMDDRLRALCEVVEEVSGPRIGAPLKYRWIRRGRLITAAISGTPMWVSDWASRVYADRVRALAARWTPDLVQLEYHVMGQYVAALHACEAPRVLVEHEPAVRSAPYLVSRGAVARWLNARDRANWRRFEAATLRKVQAVVVFTDRDSKALRALVPEAHVVIIPLGAEIPDDPLNPAGAMPPTVVFVGSFVHPPNVEAAVRLARAIFPQVQARVPDARLYIVGAQPPPEVMRLTGSSVVVTGFVPEVKPYLDLAAAVVAPLSSGGGMRVKVLEALAAGKAVVATTVAVEGLGVAGGEQLFLADSDTSFAQAVIRLLVSPDERVALAGRARAWACRNLGWERSILRYEQLYAELLDNRHR